MRTLALSGMVVAVVGVAPVEAQRLDDGRVAATNPPMAVVSVPEVSIRRVEPPDMPSKGNQVIGGILGGGIGMVVGAYAGGGLQAATAGCDREWGCLAGAVFGAAAGESIGLGTGVHLGGGRRGTLGGSVLVSVGTGLAGLLLGGPMTGGVLIPLVPVVQLVSAIAVDQQEARRKSTATSRE